VKCGRCHKDVPVLTPSPEGDLDLCSDCYAAVYRQLHAARGFPKGPLVAALVAAVVVVAVVCIVMSRGTPEDTATTPAPKTDSSALVGPNKPDPRKAPKKPAAAPAAKEPAKPAPAAEPVKPDDAEMPAEEGAEPAEEDAEPAEPKAEEAAEPKAEAPPKAAATPPAVTRIETASFVLTAGGARQTSQASVSIHGADGQTATQQLHVPETETLYEVSLTLAPTADDDIVVAGLALRVGETPFIPIQARLFGGPYLAPSEAVLLLSESATIIVSFGAEEDTIAVSDRGDELVALRRSKPASIPLTVLFALPKDREAGDAAAIVLPEGEVPVSLR